ncbi:MAG TPA: PQQ-binding-like beta-propeller repeat protein [Pirellulales bacterium]|jgi:hypothetical protein|nr:PQQ-binding-like beta-propeller repeat protein [Pirellulales bacterium]
MLCLRLAGIILLLAILHGVGAADARGQTSGVSAFPKLSAESIHPKNTHATSTIACDGQRLFVTFFNHEAIQTAALGLDGKLAWEQVAGPFNPRLFQYGYGPSPTLYDETVIVAAEYDGDSFVAALDRRTGERVWRTPRPFNITFSTPVVAHVSGQDQLLMSGANQVVSYNPKTGAELWSAPGTTAATCGTMVWDGDIVVASGGYPKAQTLAIRADGGGQMFLRVASESSGKRQEMLYCIGDQ